jgi:hypothetical protein
MQKGTLAWSTASQNLVSNWLNDYVINPTIEGDMTCRELSSDQAPFSHSASPGGTASPPGEVLGGRRCFTDVTVAPAAIVTTSSPKSMDTAKYPGGAMGAVAQAKVPVQDKFTMVKGPLSNYQI